MTGMSSTLTRYPIGITIAIYTAGIAINNIHNNTTLNCHIVLYTITSNCEGNYVIFVICDEHSYKSHI